MTSSSLANYELDWVCDLAGNRVEQTERMERKGHSIYSCRQLQVKLGFLLLKQKVQREVDGKKHRFPIANLRSVFWWYPSVKLYPDKDKSL